MTPDEIQGNNKHRLPATINRRRRRIGFLLIVLLTILMVWFAWRIPGFDALPAVGQAKVTVGSVPITYYQLEPIGKARGTVVLLASLGRPVSDFNALATSLSAAGWRTLAVESRGIGRWRGAGFWGPTDLGGFADDVVTVLDDAQETMPIVVVGHAFGNRVARMVAMRYPTRTKAVVLLAAGDQPHLPADIEASLKRSALSPLPFASRKSAIHHVFFANGNAISDNWQRGWSAWAALAQSRAVRNTPAEAFSSAGNVPVLIVQPANDVVAPPDKAGRKLAAELGKRATLIVILNAGHALLPEQPKAVADAVLEFLDKLEGVN